MTRSQKSELDASAGCLVDDRAVARLWNRLAGLPGHVEPSLSGDLEAGKVLEQDLPPQSFSPLRDRSAFRVSLSDPVPCRIGGSSHGVRVAGVFVWSEWRAPAGQPGRWEGRLPPVAAGVVVMMVPEAV